MRKLIGRYPLWRQPESAIDYKNMKYTLGFLEYVNPSIHPVGPTYKKTRIKVISFSVNVLNSEWKCPYTYKRYKIIYDTH